LLNIAPFIPANDAFKSDSGFTHVPNHSRLVRITRSIPAQSLLAGGKVPLRRHLRRHPRDLGVHLVLRKADRKQVWITSLLLVSNFTLMGPLVLELLFLWHCSVAEPWSILAAGAIFPGIAVMLAIDG
jgi:hypothetical protein